MKTFIFVSGTLPEKMHAELCCRNNGFLGYKQGEEVLDGTRYYFAETPEEMDGTFTRVDLHPRDTHVEGPKCGKEVR